MHIFLKQKTTNKRNSIKIQEWWYTSVIPALRETRDQKAILGYTEFEVNLGYIRAYLRKNLGLGRGETKLFY